MRGVIISACGSLFRVAADNCVYSCSARGILRAKNISPYCGDNVEIEQSAGEYVIKSILPRKNEIIRPPLANLDSIVFVCSVTDPPPNLVNLDKFTAVAVYKNISPIIVFTKCDLSDPEPYSRIYRDIFPTFCVNNLSGDGARLLEPVLKDKFSALCGNSGVGKSSLINNILPDAAAVTGEISKKLGRGKNTTRRTDIYPLPYGGYIADTPGFAAFSTERYDVIFKEDLAGCFPEFSEYIGGCRYNDCSHRSEQGCAVLEAMNNGNIDPSRHRSYVEMYREAANLKEWELKDRRSKNPI